MKFKIEELVSVIKKEIAQFESDLDVSEVGRVLEVGDGIARVYGLNNAMAGEVLEFTGGVQGQVFNLEEDLAMKYFHPLFEEDEEEDMTELSILPPSPSPPLPHSLIIEERCGTFMTIPWPESGILYENGEPEPCP